MKKTLLATCMVLASTLSAHAIETGHVHDKNCNMFAGLNENKTTKETVTYSDFYNTSKTEARFNEITDRVIGLYSDSVTQLGGTLSKSLDWKSDEVNAYAGKRGEFWTVYIIGGLYRHRDITDDAMALTVCHEIGHLMGGAPFYNGGKDLMSVEGQADFWATSVCMKKYITTFPEEMNQTNALAKIKCESKFADNKAEQDICYRSSMAALSITTMFGRNSKLPAIDSRDNKSRGNTRQLHPEAQCRLDTYIAGALCVLDDTTLSFEQKLMTDKLTTDFLCNEVIDGQLTKEEKRPKCWFNPINNQMYAAYKNEVVSKSFLKKDLKGGSIDVTYFNHLPGDYKITIVPDIFSEGIVTFEQSSYTFTMEAQGRQDHILFNYKFNKKTKGKMKFYVRVEFQGKIIQEKDNLIVIEAKTKVF